MIVRDGEVVEIDDQLDEGIRVANSNASFRDQRVTSDQIERHHKLLRRQHFLEASARCVCVWMRCIDDV
jgi:hypothetical protein